jgi:DNA-binding NarL/FixJ family response regulator
VAMIRLLIADDHLLVRESLKHLCAVYGGLLPVGEAANGVEVMELLSALEVDLVLMDMNMPDLSGEKLIARIRALYPELPILVFSLLNHPAVARRALRAGANGFLVKGGDPDTLVDVLHRVAAGERFLDSSVAEPALDLR